VVEKLLDTTYMSVYVESGSRVRNCTVLELLCKLTKRREASHESVSRSIVLQREVLEASGEIK
jgi:hypothetical protein